MRSIVGLAGAWNTSSTNPYVTYCYGVKEQGAQIPALFENYSDAYNGLMQTLLDSVFKNQDKNLVWRSFPEVIKYETYCPFTETTTTWYRAHARWCFE